MDTASLVARLVPLITLLVVFGAHNAECTPRVYSMSPREGGVYGGTQISIYGKELAADQFSYFEESLGHKVELYNSTTSIECDVVPYLSNNMKITCETRGAFEGNYYLRVYKDGEELTKVGGSYCNSQSSCTFKYHGTKTPVLETVTPESGTPGTIVDIYGRLFTSQYSAQQDEEDATVKIERVLYGRYISDLVNPETNELYGITPSREGSSWGTMKTRPQETTPGSWRFNFKVSRFGWSYDFTHSWRVSGKNTLYHYQTHAEITRVAPLTGSLEGGTLLTVHGNYFSEFEETTVLVGGVPCEIESISTTQITCITTRAAVSNTIEYPGARGLLYDKWDVVYSYDDDEWMTTSPELTQPVLDASSPSNLGTSFVGRIRGYFVPPRDGVYRMLVQSDDSSALYFSHSGDKTNMTKIAESDYSRRSWFRYPKQMSDKMALIGGHPYYFEARYREYWGADYVKVGAMVYDAPFVNSDIDGAINEMQRVMVRSDVDLEIQSLTIKGAVETQLVTVVYTGCENSTELYNITVDCEEANVDCSNTEEVMVQEVECVVIGDFKLSYDGQETGFIAINASIEEVQEALLNLSSMTYASSVAIATNDLVWTFTVTFDTHEDLPLLGVSVSDSSTMEAGVTEISAGNTLAEDVAFVITYDGKDTQSLTVASSALEVQNALVDLFSINCDPLRGTGIFFNDMEQGGILDELRVTDEEPFCGRTSLKNPEDIFYAGEIKDGVSDTVAVSFPFSIADKLCFAWKGTMKNSVKFTVQFTDDDGHTREESKWLFIFETEEDYVTDSRWSYQCTNIYDVVSSWHSLADDRSFKVARITLAGNDNDDYFIDNVYIGKTAISPYAWNRQPAARPNGILVADVNVTKSDAGFDIIMTPSECGHNFPLLGIKDTQLVAGSPVSDSDTAVYHKTNTQGTTVFSVVREVAASSHIAGQFTIQWNNKIVTVPFDASPKQMKDLLERLGTGLVDVNSEWTCYSHTWDIEFKSTGGSQPLIQVSDMDLTGNNVSASVVKLQEGSLILDPIPGEFLRMPFDSPQVEVLVNNIPSSCSGTCDFIQSEADTPTVTAVTPAQGKSGTSITVVGNDFDTDVANNLVTIGGVPCDVTSATVVSIVCTVGEGVGGNNKVMVKVAPSGLARHIDGEVMFEYTQAVTEVSPTSGSTAGGTIVTVTGYGFCSLCDSDSIENPPISISFNEVPCKITSISYTQITCMISKIKESSVARRRKRETSGADVTITNGDGTTTESANAFTFDSSLTPTITAVTPTTSSVLGGGVLTITGSEFASTQNKVTLGGSECVTITESATEVTCTIPPHEPGQYEVELLVPMKGYADTSLIGEFIYQLTVTGLSPDTGSIIGGSEVTITGEGFGTDTSQVGVIFGEMGCEITSLMDQRIVCVTIPAIVEHVVSNQGMHEAYGTGYRWEPNDVDIEVGDTVRWWWAIPDAVTGVSFTIQQTASEESVEYDGSGFHAGPQSAKGSYSYKFTAPGTYFYSSGPVGEGDLNMRGVIQVKVDSSAKQLEVMVGDFKAEHDTSNRVLILPAGGCAPAISLISSCDIAESVSENSQMFNFKFYQCSTPMIESISPSSGTSATPIEIRGTGFGSEICQIVVKIGEHDCIPSSVSATMIRCNIETNDTLVAGYPHLVTVHVNNYGFAINSGTNIFGHWYMLVPSINLISAIQGSTEGGTQIVITGDGFSSNLVITIGGAVCVIESAIYTEIICVTSKANAPGTYPMMLHLNNVEADCPNGCDFTYSAAITPTVTSISPTIVSGADTAITISGTRFTSTVEDVTVTIGGVECVVSSASDTEIICTVGYVHVGDAELVVSISPIGESTFADSSYKTLWSSKDIFDITSSSGSPGGSKEGGQLITITGNGFHEDDTTVTIATRECEIIHIDIAQIQCITPSKSIGEHPLQVTSGIHNYLEQTYEYSNAKTPKVGSVSPVSGKSGDSITITSSGGSGFSSAVNDNAVTIDGVVCTVTAATPSTIDCNVGDHSAGMYVIKVHVKGLGNAISSTEFEYELAIISTTPDKGSFGGGRTLALTGVGYGDKDTSTVTVCNNVCPILTISPTNIECDVPGNINSGDLDALDCDVEVTLDSEAKAKAANAWQYRKDMTPTIVSVSPKRGGTGGGTTLTIVGTDFSPSGNIVTIAGTVCQVQTESTTEIKCRTGSRAETVRSKVRVEVGDNGIATQENAEFYYVDLWSSQATWGGKDPPVEGDFVIIKSGQSVLLDVDTPILKMLLIQGGCLLFDDEKERITLNSEYILIVEAGCLQIGTEEQPYMKKATIVLHGDVRSQELPMFGAKVLAVRNGTLDLHGKPILITWTHLAETINSGDTEMTLMQPVAWNVGDQIVIASTGHRHSQRENEMLTITAISGDGRTLTFDPPVEYDHISTEQTIDGVHLEMRAEVGLLTRNVVVRGSVQEEWSEKIEECPEEFDTNQFATQTCFLGRFGEETGSDQFGGHIMLFAKEADKHLAIGRIEYVEVTHAGQAFRLGRYPIHFHLNGNVTGNYVRGCSVHRTFNRAVTIHAVHHLLVEHNVAYNIMGHAYFLEDGIETKNIIQYNLAVFVRSSSSLLNVDVTPAAYWVTNPDNYIRHNAAAGGSHFGYWYNAPEHPGGPSFTNQICPRNVPLLEFNNNTAHSMGWYGIWIFPVYYPMEGGDGSCKGEVSTPAEFYSLTAWKCERGAEAVEVGNVRFIDFLIFDNDQAGVEFQSTADAWGGPLLKDSTIIGWSDSSANISGECTVAGVKLPKSKYLTLDGVKFINFDQERCAAIHCCSHCKVDQGGFQARFLNINYDNVPNKATWQWEHECWLEDLDGSLTGKGTGFENYKVLPQNPNLSPDKCELNNIEFSDGGIPGAICDDSVKFHRMAFNQPNPESLLYKDVLFTNEHGTSHIPWHKKRITHPKGWMLTLVESDTYNFFFDDVDHVTNISYVASLDDFADGVYVLLNHNLTQAPDKFSIIGVDKNNSVTVPTYEENEHGDWFFNDEVNELTYIVSGKGLSVPTNLDIDLDVYRCFFKNCIPPPPDVLPPPPAMRPETFLVWSNTDTWTDLEDGWGNGEGVLPKDGADVMIKPGEWVVADTDLPAMNKLYIYGTLELDPTRDFVLDATYILIQGGRLIVGFEDQPFEHNGHIILRGSHGTTEIVLPGGPVMGSKALGVFGGLDLHGVDRSIYWTHLEKTVIPGDQTITVVENTDWEVNDEIVLTTTSYDPWHTETFTITSVDETTRTFTLNSTIQHKHLAGTYSISEGSTYSIRAEVGLLSRNLKIEGANYDQLFEESFGARVLVGRFVQEEVEYRGYARISNTEFYHTGQEGWVNGYDPRYSVAFVDSGEVDEVHPSYVKGCSFHNGFSPAIGLFGAHEVVVQDNVIHHVVGPGVVDWGDHNKFVHNLVSLVIFPGTYQDRFEAESLYWFGGFEIQNAKDPILNGNTVAGSERAGFKIKGEQCVEPATAWSGNVAHGALHGVHLYPENQKLCSKISNFVIYRSYDIGIYFQVSSSIMISNVVLIDNTVGVLPFITGPPALRHQTSDKFVRMENSVIVGYSPDFECGIDDNVVPDVAGHPKSQSGHVKSPDGGHVGFVWSTFSSKGNGAPFFSFDSIHAYPTISGYTELNGVVFSQFGNICSKRSYMFMTSRKNGDFMHPTYTQKIVKVNVDEESIAFIHRPNIKEVNPSDCVDMDCDGMKKAMIKDLDGTLLGSIGEVIPQSEFEWDGDARHGVGDYRIPRMMLTNLDGSRIAAEDKCPKKGIFGVHDSCTYMSSWQAYECHDIDHMVMVVESLDADTEVRRLSPIALYTDKYVDLINGPQDHGWCHGYTCQERISTFYTIVAMNKEYELYTSSTNPQRLRLHLLNAVETQKVVIGIYYTNPQRLDVYVKGLYIMPNNGKLNENGDFIWENEAGKDYKPSLNRDLYGENYFDRTWQMLYIMVKGSDPVDIVTTPVIVVTFGVPASSVDDFFEVNLIQNLVSFLGVDASQIRIVDIIAEDSSGRRRRAIYGTTRLGRAADIVDVIFEVGESPADTIEIDEYSEPDQEGVTTVATPVDVPTETPGTSEGLSFEALEEVGQILADTMQQGEMEKNLNVEVVTMAIVDPEPTPIDPTGGVHATNETGGPSTGTKTYEEKQAEEAAANEEPMSIIVYRIPSQLVIHSEASGASEREAFVAQPKIKVLDALNVMVEQLGHRSNPWRLTASVRSGTGHNQDALLIGNTTVPFSGGWVNFTDLAIDTEGSGYMLDFEITYPNSSTLAVSSSVPLSITKREYYAVMDSAPSVAYVNETFAVTVELRDVITESVPIQLAKKGYNWKATASLLMPSNYPGSLKGDLEVTFDLQTAQASFQNLVIDKSGYQYIIEVRVVTEPSSDYDFTVSTEGFDVKTKDQAEPSGKTKTYTLRFDADYKTVVGDKKKFFAINFMNTIAPMYPDVVLSNPVVEEGSIIVNFDMQGDLDSTQKKLLEDLANGAITLKFDGHMLTADNFLLVNGQDHQTKPLFPIWVVAVIVVVAIVMVVIVVLLLYWLCCRKNDKQIGLETIPMGAKEKPIVLKEEKSDVATRSTASLNSGHSSFGKQGVDTPLSVTNDEENVSLKTRQDVDGIRVNTPNRNPEVSVTPLPPGFTEGQQEQLLPDHRQMNLMARNDDSGNFIKLVTLYTNVVGSISELRQDINTALNSSTWKDKKFVMMMETLKDISEQQEENLTVCKVYASDCILIRWMTDDVSTDSKEQIEQTSTGEKPAWASVW